MKAKLYPFLFIISLFPLAVSPEDSHYIDSLNHELSLAKNATRKMLIQTEIARVMDDKDSAVIILKTLREQALGVKEKHVEMAANMALGYVYMSDNSEWTNALVVLSASESLASELQDTLDLARAKMYQADVWRLKSAPDNAAALYISGEQLLQTNSNTLSSVRDKKYLGGLAQIYQHHADLLAGQNQLDSAQLYERRAIAIYGHNAMNAERAASLTSLAKIQSKQNDHVAAIQSLNLALDVCTAEDAPELATDLSQLALEYSATGNFKMARQKGDSALLIARSVNATEIKANAFQALATIHEKETDFKLALYYSDSASILNQQILAQKSNVIIASAQKKYRLEEESIIADKERVAELRKNNIQLVGIAIFVITGIVFFIAATRKKHIAGLARVLGAIALLLMFELISLVAYPFMEKWTNHSSIFMLLILAGIAAILVPFHHRIEDSVKRWVHA